jgi:hypothetical protein
MTIKELESFSRVLMDISNPKYKGLFVFTSEKELNYLVDVIREVCLKFSAQFSRKERLITFPSGASLQLVVIETSRDCEKLFGKVFSDWDSFRLLPMGIESFINQIVRR